MDYFITFEDSGHRAALAATLQNSSEIYYARRRDNLLIGNLNESEAEIIKRDGAVLTPAQQFEPLMDGTMDQLYQPLLSHPKNLTHVLEHIHAPQAWQTSKGEDVHIAIVDTGICGTMREFPAWKQSYSWPSSEAAWTDIRGHGSMTACIAAANSQSGGRYDGVAPNAKLISCKTTFLDTEIYQIYEFLIGLVESKKVSKLVVNNSYGVYQCNPPTVNSLLVDIIRDAIGKGIVVVFAAGNNHVKVCGSDPLMCHPNTILGLNSLDEVISVGTVDENNRMDQPPTTVGGFCHRDSSRGPGQLAQTTTKPDCVAPTYGEVMWGCGYVAMEWWGTSGAAPQVAGLGALLLSKYPTLTPDQISNVVRGSCTPLPLPTECVGSGIINCNTAMSKAKTLV
jgi:subtilisin family serine protease